MIQDPSVMKRFTYYLVFVIFFLLASCKYSGFVLNKPTEWISFDVETSYFHSGNCTPIGNCHVIIHNINDSVQEIALFNEDNEAILITPEAMIHIDPNYKCIARFQKDHEVYYSCVGMALQSHVDYFPMYYPLYDENRVVLDDKAKRKVQNGDTLYILKGTKTVKYCYPNGTCQLADKKIVYLYSCRQKSFIQAIHNDGVSGKEVSTISNIDYSVQSALIDSVFNIADKRYDDYERLSINEYYPHLTQYTRNTRMNDTVLDFPLVNLASGDTTSLRQMQGTTLLYFYNFYLDNEWYSTVESLGRRVADSIIWLMPVSNNVERLNQLAAEERLGTNLYYAKGFTRHLIVDNNNQAYLISSDHKTVSIFNRIETFEEWMGKLLTEPTP